jgi:DNA-binding transcriptional MerR regulator
MAGMITIGQLAAYAGVTIKAVRHYHQRGLLEEPPRDSSGYRRYGAKDAIDLIKIKTLADAGVPLARVRELLAADPERFAAAIAEIDESLQQRTVELIRTRERITQLGAGDRLFVPADVAEYLDELRGHGASERLVEMERDACILLQTASPAEAPAIIAGKRDLMRDPEFRALYLEYDAAFDWSVDDPRLESLAERSVRWFTAKHDEGPGADATLARLVTRSTDLSSPAWTRLGEIAARRRRGG